MVRLKLPFLFLFISLCLNSFAQQSENSFKEEELTFSNKDAVYSGTLSFPSEQGIFPAVILISGMGPQDRDWAFNRGTYKMAKGIADHLNKNGIAVLRYDDRGTGKSTGTPESETSFSDLAEDISVAVNMLKERENINKVGLLGHSLGGILAVLEASKYNNVDFIISLAGSFRTGENILREQARTLKPWKTDTAQTDDQVIANGDRFATNLVSYFQNGTGLDTVKTILNDLIKFQISNLPEDVIEENLKHYKDVEEFEQKSYEGALRYYTSPHRKSFLTYDTSIDFAKVLCPVAVIFGENDKHVTVKANKPHLIRALQDAQTNDFTLRILPGTDHGFTTPELAKDGKVLPELLNFLTDWILPRVN